MQNTTTIFRTLIVSGFAIAMLASCIDFFIASAIPPELDSAYQALLSQQWSEARLLFLGGLSLLVAAAGIAGTVGLYLFKPWARPVALWTSVVSVFSAPLLGVQLLSGWSFMLTEVSMILWGAALAMAYFSELAPRFERTAA